MARARNIKPGFFRNADLVDLPFEARLLFIGLWTIADRAGRIEDRPKQIKMELFPADNVDCDSLIGQLTSMGMVQRYEHDGKRYLQVVNFTKHQNPHRDEKASTLPGPCGFDAKAEDGSSEHCTNTVQAPCEHGANTVAIGLIPDPLIPDPLTEAKASSSSAKHDAVPPCPHTELIDLFGQHLPMLPQPKVEAWGGARAKALQARWRWVLTAKKRDGTRYASSRDEALDWFARYFAFVSRSDFLSGRDGKWTGCDLGWLANETNFAKVIQGNYDNRELEAA